MSAIEKLEAYFDAHIRRLHSILVGRTALMTPAEARPIVLAEADAYFALFKRRERFLRGYAVDASDAVNSPALAAHGCICLVVNYEIHGVAKRYEARLYVPEAPPGWPMLPQDQG